MINITTDEIRRLRAETHDAYGYLSRLLVHLHPDIHLLDDLMGVCTQIDNAIAGLRAENERLMVEAGLRTQDDEIDTVARAIQRANRPVPDPLNSDQRTAQDDSTLDEYRKLARAAWHAMFAARGGK